MTKLIVDVCYFSNVPKRPLFSVVPITNTFRDLMLIIFPVPVSVVGCVCLRFVCLFSLFVFSLFLFLCVLFVCLCV
jgi:hypothetical protein